MFRSRTLSASTRPGRHVLVLAALFSAFALASCSSDPPPDMNTVRKLVQEDRQFDALKVLIPLATEGDPQAQYELAGFYHYGYVGANDFSKALKWYRASARQGYADSMVGLSVMYLGGQGVAKDRREAFVWLNLAAQYMTDQRALAKVKAVRDEIGRTLTPDDIAFAKAQSLLLQPDSASVQPNEAESIDHLPESLPPQEPASVSVEPLQNVPPETAPLNTIPLNTAPAPASSTPSLPQMELQPSLPAAPRPATTTPATTMPVTTMPVTTVPASTMPAPTPPITTPVTTPATTPITLPATTPPATPQPLPPPPLPPSTVEAAPVDGVDPVPEF